MQRRGSKHVSRPLTLDIAVVQSLSQVQLFATTWTAACQASLSFTIWGLLKLMSNESMMPSNHLILCCSLLLLPSIFYSVRVFPNELVVNKDIYWLIDLLWLNLKCLCFKWWKEVTNGQKGSSILNKTWQNTEAQNSKFWSLVIFGSIYKANAFYFLLRNIQWWI